MQKTTPRSNETSEYDQSRGSHSTAVRRVRLIEQSLPPSENNKTQVIHETSHDDTTEGSAGIGGIRVDGFIPPVTFSRTLAATMPRHRVSVPESARSD